MEGVKDGNYRSDPGENRGICEELGEVDDRNAAALMEETRERPPIEAESTCPQCGKQGRYEAAGERKLVTRRGSNARATLATSKTAG